MGEGRAHPALFPLSTTGGNAEYSVTKPAVPQPVEDRKYRRRRADVCVKYSVVMRAEGQRSCAHTNNARCHQRNEAKHVKSDNIRAVARAGIESLFSMRVHAAAPPIFIAARHNAATSRARCRPPARRGYALISSRDQQAHDARPFVASPTRHFLPARPRAAARGLPRVGHEMSMFQHPQRRPIFRNPRFAHSRVYATFTRPANIRSFAHFARHRAECPRAALY